MVKKSLRNIFQTAVAVALSVSLLSPTMPSWAASAEMERTAGNKSVPETGGVEQYDSIDGLSDEILYDMSGNRVRACGGEVHQYTEDGVTKWYWFGEDIPGTSAGSADAVPSLHLYSSTDLYNWTREEDILKGMTSKEQFETDEYFKNLYGDLSDAEKDIVFEFLKNCPTAHPKMLYHASKQQYVMWMTSMNGKACITTSNSIKGPFKFVKYCEDMSSVGLMYQDSDGSAYAFYNNGGQAVVARLTDDYMGIDGNSIQSIGSGMVSMVSEGGMFERDGKYYMVNAGTGQYAMADSLTGSWSLHSLQMCDDSGQVSQIASMNPTSCVFRVNTENGVEYINMSDKWTYAESDSERYIWLPLKFSQDGTMALRNLSNWKLDGIVPEEPVVPPTPQEYDSIDGLSGEILYDTDGERVYACGGEVHQFTENGEKKWYWFGVDDLEMDVQKKHLGIHLYSSTDLYNWKHEGTMDEGGKFGFVAHPKVLYNEQQHQYVMWASAQSNGITRTIVATSNSIKGPFTVVEGAGGGISGFINLYQDSAGEAYLLSMGTGGLGLSLAKLSDDYTAIDGTPQLLEFTGNNSLYAAEGGIFERNGKYYIVNAGSPDSFGPQYAVADSLSGPWTLHKIQMWDEESQGFEDIVSKNQTSDVFHVKTDKIDTYVCVGDSVGNIDAPEVVRYIWLPIKFLENDEIALEKLSNWKFEEKEEEPPVPIEVTEVKLTETSKTLKVEEEYQINATVLPANAENRTLTYRSGDETVATVSASGKVLAKKVGNTTITVTSANGKKAELQLTVEKKGEKPPAPIEVTEIRLTERSKTLKVGDEYQITAVVLPANAEDRTLTYRSGDETVATVSNSGKVQATKAGTTTITVTSTNGTKAELQLKVEEKEEEPPAPIEVTEVQLTETSKTLKVGDEYQINATALPADAENRTLTYKSGNETVATVSNGGKVLARKVGNTTITVTSANGKKAELQLKVEAVPVKTVEVQSVLVSTKKLTVGVGEKVQLEAGVYPRNASDRKLTYKPSNNKVEVSKKGRITAKKAGDCKITISASNGEKAVVKVTVKKKPGKISLNAKKKTLKAGKKFQIKPKLPKGTASYNITYVSNSKSVAVVDKKGKVTAKKKGNAVITVKTYNGKKAILKLRVK